MRTCEGDLGVSVFGSLGPTAVIARDMVGVEFFGACAQGMDSKERRAIYSAMARVLAAIHSADVDAIGLSRYGRMENYCKRQVWDF